MSAMPKTAKEFTSRIRKNLVDSLSVLSGHVVEEYDEVGNRVYPGLIVVFADKLYPAPPPSPICHKEYYQYFVIVCYTTVPSQPDECANVTNNVHRAIMDDPSRGGLALETIPENDKVDSPFGDEFTAGVMLGYRVKFRVELSRRVDWFRRVKRNSRAPASPPRRRRSSGSSR